MFASEKGNPEFHLTIKKKYNKMKTQTILLTISILLSSCQSFINDIDFLFKEKIVLKGQISTSQAIKGMQKVSSNKSAYTLSDAKKVLIFYGNQYVITEIDDNGSFTGKVPIGNSTVVSFLTKDNKFIGNLYTGGLNFLPLKGLDDDISVIDFSTLTLENGRIFPANDPIGKSIILNEAELGFMKEIGKFYESMAKNIDMDNDGVPDLYKNISIFLSTTRNFEAGTFGVQNSKPAQITKEYNVPGCNSLTIEGYVDWFSKQIVGISNHAKLTGPLANPYNDIVNTYAQQNFPDDEKDKESYQIQFVRNNQQNYFEDGRYTFQIDNQDFTFDYYFNLNMKDFWIYAVPSCNVDKDGYVTSIEIDYRLKDGRKVNPKKVISSSISLTIAIEKYSSEMDVYDSWGENGQSEPGKKSLLEIVRRDILTSLDKNYNFDRITLEVPVKLSNIQQMGTSYYDMFGNDAGNSWKP